MSVNTVCRCKLNQASIAKCSYKFFPYATHQNCVTPFPQIFDRSQVVMSSVPLSRQSTQYMYQLDNRLGVCRFDFDSKTMYPVHGLCSVTGKASRHFFPNDQQVFRERCLFHVCAHACQEQTGASQQEGSGISKLITSITQQAKRVSQGSSEGISQV